MTTFASVILAMVALRAIANIAKALSRLAATALRHRLERELDSLEQQPPVGESQQRKATRRLALVRRLYLLVLLAYSP